MQANIDLMKEVPFEWGKHDCALFARNHVKALTGVDVISDFEGTYSTALGAIKALKSYGYDNLYDFCQKNFPEVHISQLRTGDLVVLNSEDTGYGIGIVLSGEAIGVLSPNVYGTIRKNDQRIVSGFKIAT